MKKILAWPTPLLQKWLLSLLLCLPFLAAAIISAFSGDRTFLILSALLLLFCGVRCAELYVYLPVSTVVIELKKAYLPQPCALAVEKIEPVSFDCVESAD